MGWKFRKSIKLGLFRVNLSRSGIGYSVGVRGMRYGKDAKGRKYRALSIPGTGIFRRDYFPSNPSPRPQASWFAPPRIFLLGALFLILLWVITKSLTS
jgi:hypothetical protein